MSAELKPCPFCGSADTDPKFAATNTGGVITDNPGCMDCGAMAETVEAWNRLSGIVAERDAALADADYFRKTCAENKRPFSDKFSADVIAGQVKEMDALRATNAALTRELSELRADKARLDWLIKQGPPGATDGDIHLSEEAWDVAAGFVDDYSTDAEAIRAAIDALSAAKDGKGAA